MSISFCNNDGVFLLNIDIGNGKKLKLHLGLMKYGSYDDYKSTWVYFCKTFDTFITKVNNNEDAMYSWGENTITFKNNKIKFDICSNDDFCTGFNLELDKTDEIMVELQKINNAILTPETP
jgi:hypothetical protein